MVGYLQLSEPFPVIVLRAKQSLLECDLEFPKDHSLLAFSVSRGKRE